MHLPPVGPVLHGGRGGTAKAECPETITIVTDRPAPTGPLRGRPDEGSSMLDLPNVHPCEQIQWVQKWRVGKGMFCPPGYF